MKSIDLIKTLVEKELREYEGDSNMVPLIPHKTPAADTDPEEYIPTETDHLYKLAVKARIATEELVKQLDEPIYDGAYEHAFKATMSLRQALNELIAVGAEPEEEDRIVAPPTDEQPGHSSTGFIPMSYSGGSAV
jgi:hypothetical protein|tara:strand:- start:3563 stop:3967 length:405 start_codon:yes stop_codon:yes gene_type:complete